MSKKFEIPAVLNYDRMDDQDYVECHEASWSHPKQLKKAEGEISNAIDFCETLRSHLIEEEAYTVVTVVEHIEKLIRKARNRLDGTADGTAICSLPTSISKRQEVRNESHQPDWKRNSEKLSKRNCWSYRNWCSRFNATGSSGGLE